MVGLLLRQFSKLLVSATHPPLQRLNWNDLFRFCDAKLGIIFESAKDFADFFSLAFGKDSQYTFNCRLNQGNTVREASDGVRQATPDD